MNKRILHMIGNSHIDPVWFWTREEGMQAVCATFAAALERMAEEPDIHFTCTSAAFFAFVEKARPDLLIRLKEAYDSGKLEITGGWWVEPDCCLPSGESLVRQGLYGQRTFERIFGKPCRIGSNVDSFGHSPALPQLLLGCGMDRYVFMRPSFARSERPYMPEPASLVDWAAPDASRVLAFSLPAEYTCWFEESLRENVENTLKAMAHEPAMACFFGVGNHGGGPTRANIEAVKKLQREYPEFDFRFSTLSAFFEEAERGSHPLITGALEHINSGCYSVDHRFKQRMRLAEQYLLRAERMHTLCVLNGLSAPDPMFFRGLWERLLFNQFHDTLGGTEVLEARDNAMRDLGGVSAQAEESTQISVQHLINALDTRGEGHPLVLINDTDRDVEGVMDTEFYWFCNSPLTIQDETGREIPYQRVKQSCTMKWYHLGGRRRVLFRAKIPAMGYTVLRLSEEEPKLHSQPAPEQELVLENEYIRVLFSKNGEICSLFDKQTGFEALTGPLSLRVWIDQGDSWGHRSDGQILEEKGSLPCVKAERVESGIIRNTVRMTWEGEEGQLRALFHLDQGERFLKAEIWALWRMPWARLKIHIPLDCNQTVAEGPHCEIFRSADRDEYFMHRYVDGIRKNGSGLLCINDGVYAFDTDGKGTLDMTLLRSAIYSHSNCKDWYDEHDTYDYVEMGEHRWRFLLIPHGQPLSAWDRIGYAERLSSPPQIIVDMIHPAYGHFLSPTLQAAGIHMEAMKPGEDGGIVIRFRETNGCKVQGTLRFSGRIYDLSFDPYALKTVLIRDYRIQETDLLEQ